MGQLAVKRKMLKKVQDELQVLQDNLEKNKRKKVACFV